MAFVVPGGTEAVSISVWDQQADAGLCSSSQVLKAVANVVEGTHGVDTYEVSNSTPSIRSPRAWPSNAAKGSGMREGRPGPRLP